MLSYFFGKNDESKITHTPDQDTNSITQITNYQQTFIPCFTKKSGDLRIAIRNYDCNLGSYFVTVDPFTLVTECAPVTQYNHRKITDGQPGYYTKKEIEATPYVRALTQFTSPPYRLQNYGLTQAIHPINGAFLTI